MSVADLAHEAAKRYCAAVPLPEWTEEVLDRLGVPRNVREPEAVDELEAGLSRVAGVAADGTERRIPTRLFQTCAGAASAT